MINMTDTDRIYNGDVGVKFEVNTGIDLTAATGLYIKTTDPTGATDTWVGTMNAASSYVIDYTSGVDELIVSGGWKGHAFVEFSPTSVHSGQVFKFKVWDKFK